MEGSGKTRRPIAATHAERQSGGPLAAPLAGPPRRRQSPVRPAGGLAPVAAYCALDVPLGAALRLRQHRVGSGGHAAAFAPAATAHVPLSHAAASRSRRSRPYREQPGSVLEAERPGLVAAAVPAPTYRAAALPSTEPVSIQP